MLFGKTIALAFAATLLAAASLPVGAQTIRIGTVADYKPYNSLDDEGVVQGFEADLERAICTRAGLDCSWSPAPWDELSAQLQNGDLDVILSAFEATSTHKAYFSLTDTYFPATRGAILVRSLDPLPPAGSIVGVERGSSAAQYALAKGWSLAEFDTPADGVEALKNNEVAAYVGDQAHLGTVVTDTPDSYRIAAKDIDLGSGLAMAVPHSRPDLLAALNTSLAALKADGTLDRLIGRWFDGRDPKYSVAEK